MYLSWKGILPIQGEVVIIEDDPTLCSLLVDLMVEIGAKATSFHTADDAVTYLLTTQGDCRLVIVDHDVPGQIQGIEFIQMVKSRWPQTAAILNSGFQLEPSAVPSDTFFLLKPWSLDDMIVAVAALVQPGFPITKSV